MTAAFAVGGEAVIGISDFVVSGRYNVHPIIVTKAVEFESEHRPSTSINYHPRFDHRSSADGNTIRCVEDRQVVIAFNFAQQDSY